MRSEAEALTAKHLYAAIVLSAILLSGTLPLLVAARHFGLISVALCRGQSMEPNLHDGDLILMCYPWMVRTGDVIVFRDPEHGRLIAHRVIAVGEYGCFRTMGDNNHACDPWSVCEPEWKVIWRLPYQAN